MFEFQSQLIFPTHAVPAPAPLPPTAERLQVPSADGPILHGVHIPAPRAGSSTGKLILGFGGNAWNAEDVAIYLREIYPEADVIVFHYRGYAPSAGSPSAEALLADAPLIYDAAVARVRPRSTIAVGFSIGSGVAASLTTQRRPDGLILVTPFDSLEAVAQGMYPWLPIGPLFRHEIDAAKALEKSDVPVAIVAAQRDQIIPPARTQALRRRVPRLLFDRVLVGAGHNDIYARSDFHQAMREALAAVSK